MSRKRIRVTHPGGLKPGFYTRVYIDGEDVSHNVTEVEITIYPDKLPVVKLTVIDVEMDISSLDPELKQWEGEGGHLDEIE